jgi:hypothetical protein
MRSLKTIFSFSACIFIFLFYYLIEFKRVDTNFFPTFSQSADSLFYVLHFPTQFTTFWNSDLSGSNMSIFFSKKVSSLKKLMMELPRELVMLAFSVAYFCNSTRLVYLSTSSFYLNSSNLAYFLKFYALLFSFSFYFLYVLFFRSLKILI